MNGYDGEGDKRESRGGTTDDSRAEGNGDKAPSIVFKKRNKARAAGSSEAKQTNALGSATMDNALLGGRSKLDKDDDAEEEEASSSVVVGAAGRRSVGLRGNGASSSRRHGMAVQHPSRVSTSQIQFSQTDDYGGDDPFAVRKEALSQHALMTDDDAASALPSYMQQQASIDEDSAYSPKALAELRAYSNHFAGRERSFDSTLDVENGLRGKFAADFAHDGIPSESVIRAAKEKRRRGAAEREQMGSEDFIYLRETRGPHPESRLQRDEDEVGSGEEEFSSFTGATDRVALDGKGKELEKERERQERREALDAAMEDETLDSDDSERAWEKAQLGRVDAYPNDGTASVRKSHTIRETPPFKPAPIPRTAPLPSITSTSTRIQQKLNDLHESISAQERLHHDAIAKLDQLAKDEERNKDATESAAEREAWFRELEQFLLNVALFLEQKMPGLLDVERAWTGQLALRSRLLQKARAEALNDQLSLFYGVPVGVLYEREEENAQPAYDPAQDGGPLSEIRNIRRQHAHASLSGQLCSADQIAIESAQHQIRQTALGLLDDVQADEYRDPAVRVALPAKTDEAAQVALATTTTSKLHPASLVARFHRWRKLYGAEYNDAWGGLTLASIWDFWIRRSLCGWDTFRIPSQEPNSLDGFKWYKDLTHYAEKGQENDGEQVWGGDDEVVAHAFTNTVVPFLVKLCERGAFDAWSSLDHASAMDVMVQMTYVLEKDEPRFQSLVSAFLTRFEKQIDLLVKALHTLPAFPPPAISPDGPKALLSCTEFVYTSLVCHLVAWHRFVHPSSTKSFLVRLTETIVREVLFVLFEMAQYVEGGKDAVHGLASDLATRTIRPGLLGEAIQLRLKEFMA